MSASKKGKKNKGTAKLSLGDFLNSGPAAPDTIQVPVKVKSWADECEDDDDDKPLNIKLIDLPTAPKASRVFNEDNFPSSPPFQVYISNLPFDLDENDLYDLFGNMVIASIRLPREDGENGRLRGFGYVEFETRQDLIEAVQMPDPHLRGRRIRIEVSSESDQKRGNRNRNYENRNHNDDGGNTNWRDRPDSSRPHQQERRTYNRDYNNRDKDREDRPSNDSAGSWRTGDRPVQQQRSPPPERRQYGGDRRRGPPREQEKPMERPKIVLQPRTLPLPVFPKPPPEDEEKENVEEKREPPVVVEKKPEPVKVPAANIFGSAKPVDTAAREREIEEKLQEQERLAKEKQKEERERIRLEKEQEKAGSMPEKDEVEKTDPVKETNDKDHIEPKAEKKEEVISWRSRTEQTKDGEGVDGRRSPPQVRKYSPDRKGGYNNRRNDNRDNRDMRDMRDNRNRDNRDNKQRDNRNRDYNRIGSGMTGVGGIASEQRDRYRDNRSFRDNRPRIETNRDKERDVKEKDREAKPIEERMPKYQAPSGPNLSMTNQFAGLLPDDVDE